MYYVLVSDHENTQENIYSFAETLKEARAIGDEACAPAPNSSCFLIADAEMNILSKEEAYR